MVSPQSFEHLHSNASFKLESDISETQKWSKSSQQSMKADPRLKKTATQGRLNYHYHFITNHHCFIWIFYQTQAQSISCACHPLTHWLTNWLNDSRFVNLIELTLACEDDNSKLVKVVTVADVDDEKRADNSLVQIWKVKFGHKVKFLFILWAQGFKVWSRFWSWFLVKILKMSDQDLCKNLWYDLKKLLW